MKYYIFPPRSNTNCEGTIRIKYPLLPLIRLVGKYLNKVIRSSFKPAANPTLSIKVKFPPSKSILLLNSLLSIIPTILNFKPVERRIYSFPAAILETLIFKYLAATLSNIHTL